MQEGKTEDILLYRRFLEGDEESLEKLIALYRHGLLRFLYSYVQDFALAEDVFVDVFATLYFKRPYKERENASLKTYLYTLARNKALNAIKKRKRRREFSLDALMGQGDSVESVYGLYSPIPSPDFALERKERNKKLYEGLNKLPLQYREALILRYFDDLPPEKIAKILKKSPKQVYNLLARGKLALKTILLENAHENG